MDASSVSTISANTINTQYNGPSKGNPFVEALPELLNREQFFEQIASYPEIPHNISHYTAEQRRVMSMDLLQLFIPMGYMYDVYDMLYRFIFASYNTKNAIDTIKQINSLYSNNSGGYLVQAESGSILGVPGIGKTSTIKRCLEFIPQVISHTQYNGSPLYTKQITHLFVECPNDCSVKTLIHNIAEAIDRAIGSKYVDKLAGIPRTSASTMAARIKIACLTHHVGLIVIDEIQNAVVTAKQNNATRPLIKFLLELTNDTCTSICFVGTLSAEEMFTSQEHLKRRTRGLRISPLQPDATYHRFLSEIWRYQYITSFSKLTDKLATAMYEHSAGIPAYIIKIFHSAQLISILDEREVINEKTIRTAIERMAIYAPKVYNNGVSISNFEKQHPAQEMEAQADTKLYVVQRGRKKVVRDAEDIMELYKNTNSNNDMLSLLTNLNLSEVL